MTLKSKPIPITFRSPQGKSDIPNPVSTLMLPYPGGNYPTEIPTQVQGSYFYLCSYSILLIQLQIQYKIKHLNRFRINYFLNPRLRYPNDYSNHRGMERFFRKTSLQNHTILTLLIFLQLPRSCYCQRVRLITNFSFIRAEGNQPLTPLHIFSIFSYLTSHVGRDYDGINLV